MGKSTGGAAGFTAREWREVGWKQPDAGDAAFDGFALAVEYDWLSGLDPFLDVAWGNGDEVGYRGGKDVAVGGKHGGFVLEQVV